MPITKITTTSTVFDVENVSPGDLVALWDSHHDAQHLLIGTGIVIEVTQLDITCALYTGKEHFEETTTRYRIDLEKVVNGQLTPVIIKPMELSPKEQMEDWEMIQNPWKVEGDAWR